MRPLADRRNVRGPLASVHGNYHQRFVQKLDKKFVRLCKNHVELSLKFVLKNYGRSVLTNTSRRTNMSDRNFCLPTAVRLKRSIPFIYHIFYFKLTLLTLKWSRYTQTLGFGKFLSVQNRNRPEIRLNPVPAGFRASKSGSGSGPVSSRFAGSEPELDDSF